MRLPGGPAGTDDIGRGHDAGMSARARPALVEALGKKCTVKRRPFLPSFFGASVSRFSALFVVRLQAAEDGYRAVRRESTRRRKEGAFVVAFPREKLLHPSLNLFPVSGK